MVIAGEKTLLRPVTQEDLPVINAWDDDPEIQRLVGKKFISNIDFADSATKRANRIEMAVIDRASGTLIGNVEIENISWRRRSGELRICIGNKEFWGRGYGTDAITAFALHVFSSTRLHDVFLRVYRSNRRAIACYKKCGFRAEAILKAGSRTELGHEDLLLMRLLRVDEESASREVAATS